MKYGCNNVILDRISMDIYRVESLIGREGPGSRVMTTHVLQMKLDIWKRQWNRRWREWRQWREGKGNTLQMSKNNDSRTKKRKMARTPVETADVDPYAHTGTTFEGKRMSEWSNVGKKKERTTHECRNVCSTENLIPRIIIIVFSINK